jgi:hypothetical protein
MLDGSQGPNKDWGDLADKSSRERADGVDRAKAGIHRRKEGRMGVEYAHYLIPEDNTYKPRPEDLGRLVDALLDGGFVHRAGSDAFKKMTFDNYTYYEHARQTGCYVHFGRGEYAPFPCPCSDRDIAAMGDQDFKLVWPVESSNQSGLKYPLTPFPEWGDAYYDLELHMGKDYVYHLSELIDPFDHETCPCGQALDYYQNDDKDDDLWRTPVFYDSRIRRICPACNRTFRPQELVARVRDGYTGEAIDRAGGATYLFAVVIDCGKGFAREGWPMRASDEFLDKVTKTLGQKFYQLGDIY